MKKILGHILSGSLTEGFIMRVHPATSSDDIKTGRFVSIAGPHYTFFSMVTDLSLAVTNPEILQFPPGPQEKLLNELLQHKDMYATAQLKPMLMVNAQKQIMPVKTIPSHFCPVYEATKEDVALIFGDEHEPTQRYFNIGCPLDMQTPVCLDLEKLTERSNGIFGKTGTGKTFLTRLVLAGLIKQEKAVTIIFDMHSEYGLQARTENKNQSFVKGLKTLFPSRMSIFSLDPESTRRRGAMADVALTIPYQAVNVEDIMSLQEELNLHSTAVEAAYLISARYKQEWLQTLLSQGDRLKDFAQELGAHPESIAALYRKLKRIERLPFFIPTQGAVHFSALDHMMELINKGINVIIEFGNFSSTFCYLLVANVITRKIHQEFVAKTEKFLGSQRAEDEPKKLMICIEEAHKFLNSSAARQTIFGIIAREMRKYYVSLLIVDQRPSGIDPEIISQIGTKIVAQLNDEKDMQAVLTGCSNSQQLRTVIGSLDSKKQALLFGHAVAMPVVVQTREYNDEFYKAMSLIAASDINAAIKELF